MIFFTATSNDYMAVVDLPLAFSSIMDRHCLNVTVNDDSLLENEESFDLNLNTDDPMVTLTPRTSNVRIVDKNSKN